MWVWSFAYMRQSIHHYLRCRGTCNAHGGRCGYLRSATSVQVPTVVNGEAISEVGYVLGTSADNFRSAYLEAAFVENLVSVWAVEVFSRL